MQAQRARVDGCAECAVNLARQQKRRARGQPGASGRLSEFSCCCVLAFKFFTLHASACQRQAVRRSFYIFINSNAQSIVILSINLHLFSKRGEYQLIHPLLNAAVPIMMHSESAGKSIKPFENYFLRKLSRFLHRYLHFHL